ncbi:MAG: hypothetical protein J5983_01145 [Ruminococcus sp.]|nr:hypothetical protein [Ruminococcus sp.]
MKGKIKRSLALLMAVAMIAQTVFVDGTMTAQAAELPDPTKGTIAFDIWGVDNSNTALTTSSDLKITFKQGNAVKFEDNDGWQGTEELEPGEYSYTIAHDDYVSAEGTVTVEEGKAVSVSKITLGKNVTKTFNVTYAGVNLTGATVKFTSGSDVVTATENNGTYSATLVWGKTYSVSTTCTGFAVAASEYAPNGDNSVTIAAKGFAEVLEVTAGKTGLNVTKNETTTASIKSGSFNGNGVTYTYSSSDENVITVNANTGEIKPVAQGKANVILTRAIGNTSDKATLEISVYEDSDLEAKLVSVKTEGNEDVTANKGVYEFTYGDDRTLKVEVTEDEETNGTISYSADESGVVSVDENGVITLNKAGTGTITISRAATGYWTEASTTVTVKVAKKTVNPLDSDITTFELKEARIYNAEQTIAVEGSVAVDAEDGVETAGEVVKVTATLQLPSADAGTYDASKEIIKVTEWSLTSDRYALPELEESATISVGTFEVKPKDLTITVSGPGKVNYGDMPSDTGLTPNGVSISVNGLCDSDENSFKTNTTDKLTVIPVTGIKAVGEYDSEIKVDIDKANVLVAKNSKDTTNYVFTENGHTWAKLIVEQETISNAVYSLQKMIEYSGTNVYVENDTTNYFPWIKTDDGKLFVTVKVDGTVASRYDAVMCGDVNLSTDGISASDISSDTLTVKFKNTENGSESNTFDIKVKEDGTIPSLEFSNDFVEKATVVQSMTKSISFGTFKQVNYVAEYSVSDEEAGFTPSDIDTYVWLLSTTDLTDGKVTKATVEAKISDTANPISWTDASNDTTSVVEEGDYSVIVATADEGKEAEVKGNYIVLVKVKDKVGNEKVYASNGIVIDIDSPSVEIEIEKPKSYYDGDVTYTITADDGSGLAVSGISEVTWKVMNCTCEEKNKDGSCKVNSGSKSYVKENELLSTTDLAEVKTITNTINSACCDSNNIELSVTAIDRSGTEIASDSTVIMIDKTNPVVAVEYDNNEVTNGKYFQKVRTATVTVTERNIDRNKVTFDLELEDGTVCEDVTIAGLDALEDVKAYWVSDSQENIEVTKLTNDRANIAKIEFVGDNHYSGFDVTCIDLAGRSNVDVNYGDSEAPTDFVIDTIDPKVNIEYKVVEASGTAIPLTVGKNEGGRVYKNQTITATVTITEHNFAVSTEKNAKYGFAEYNVAVTKNPEEIDDYNAIANTDAENSTWTSTGDADVRYKTFTFDMDGNYTNTFTYTDLSGRTFTWDADYFTVDKTAPTGSVKVGERNAVEEFINAITFYIFSENNIPVDFKGADFTSPIDPLEFYVTDNPLKNKEAVAAVTEWTEGESYTIKTDSQKVPYLKVTDKAGNVEYFSSDVIAIADNTDPVDKTKPMITITTSQPTYDIFNGNVNFTMYAEDPEVGSTYAGLSSVTYEILKDGVVTESNTYLYDAQKRQKNMTTNEVVTASLNNSNDVQIRVTAVDNAGNTATETKDIAIDITKPSIAVTFDNNSPLNGQYYNATRTATVVITERNFNENDVQINVTNSDGTPAAISGWRHSAANGVSDATTHTATITFAADGDYKFTVDCADLALNKAENPYTSEEFTIDKTNPVINVSYDNNSAQYGNYYQATRTATITITEHNFRASDVQITTTSSGSMPTISGWSTSGDRHTATVYFGSDADYTFDIAYSDLAGNAAADYAQDSFTVDLTNPTVEIGGVADRSANKGKVAPTITINDTNFTSDRVTITLKGAKKGVINTSGMMFVSSTATGQNITFSNFGDDMDDVYTLTAEAVDKAGNETTKTIMFSVNRHGSTYAVSKDTQAIMDKGYTNSPKDIVIVETNVDTLEFIELSYSKDGKIVKLTENKDYKVTVTGGEGQWKQYTYTIFAECFEEEGKYNINISSIDRAENESNNKVQSMTVEFVVDKTAPTMAISNLEDRGRYKEDTHQFTLNVKDNTKLSKVEVYLDGELVQVIEGEDLIIENGKVYIDIDSKNSFQEVKLIAYDEAGNATEPVEYSVLVTSNAWLQFVANKPLFYGCIIGLVAILFIIFFIIWKRRKDDEEEENTAAK